MKSVGLFVVLASLLVGAWFWWAQHEIEVATYLVSAVGKDITKAGTWGDTFGAFNALVSALGFAAVITTLWLQAKSIKDQAKDLHRQRFESTYFELLRLLREVREDISFRQSKEYAERIKIEKIAHSPRIASLSHMRKSGEGNEAIRLAVTELRYWLAPARARFGSRDVIQKIYEKNIHKSSEVGLGPYFRIIYTILNRLREDAVLTVEEKASYGNLLRSQLTSEEITLLAINALSPFAKDLEDLLVEFHMLKYLPQSSMRRNLESVFSERAFQSRS